MAEPLAPWITKPVKLGGAKKEAAEVTSFNVAPLFGGASLKMTIYCARLWALIPGSPSKIISSPVLPIAVAKLKRSGRGWFVKLLPPSLETSTVPDRPASTTRPSSNWVPPETDWSVPVSTCFQLVPALDERQTLPRIPNTSKSPLARPRPPQNEPS